MATKKPTPKPKPTPTKKGLNVAVPGGGTYNTETKKTTMKPKDIPFKKMTPAQYEAQLKKAVAEHNRALRNK
jgi:hypothetical protein